MLSVVFGALTSILVKIGIESINSNLAVAIRTSVVLVMAWGIVFITMILAFIVLKETVTAKAILGGILITLGTFVMIL